MRAAALAGGAARAHGSGAQPKGTPTPCMVGMLLAAGAQPRMERPWLHRSVSLHGTPPPFCASVQASYGAHRNAKLRPVEPHSPSCEGRLCLLLEARPVEGRRPASAFGPIEVMTVLK